MPADLTARLAFASVVAIPLALIFHARRRSAAASQAAAHRNAEKAAAVKAAAARASAAPARKKKAPQPDDSSESEEEQVDEREQELWKRVEEVLKDYSLSPLMIAASRKWVRQMSDPNNEQLARLRQWMLHRINGRLAAPIKPPLSEWQRGCPEILAGLRAQPFWDRGVFDWLRPFEEHFNEIRAELLALRSQRGFQPLKIPNWASKKAVASPDGAGSVSHDQGNWNVFYLFLHEVAFPDNCARCPVTTRLLEALPRSYQHAFFSALTPGTHIIKHHGPTNKKLRIHLPLVGAAAGFKWPPPCLTTPPHLPPWTIWRLRPLPRTPKRRPSISEACHGLRSPPQAAPKSRILRFQPPGAAGSELRVAEQHVQNREGECMVFDDSFEHEAWHRGTDTRIVLVFDVWHPDLSDREVHFLSSLQRARMRAEMAMEKAARAAREEAASREGRTLGPDDSGDDFFKLLQDARDLLPDNSWWTGEEYPAK